MIPILKEFTREELERKLLHMISFTLHQLILEYLERTEPVSKVIRMEEAELENDKRIRDHIVSIFPALDICKLTHPEAHEALSKWIIDNHELIIVSPCLCEGCKI